MKKVFFLILSLLCLAATPEAAQSSRLLTPEELISEKRLPSGSPAFSPDGKQIVLAVYRYGWTGNSLTGNLWLIPADGSPMRQLTKSEIYSSSNPMWSADGKSLAFICSKEGGPQLWTLHPESGKAEKLTSVGTGVQNAARSAGGDLFLFLSPVDIRAKNDEEQRKLALRRKANPVKALVYENLSFSQNVRTHLFVVSADGGVHRDLTEGKDYDVRDAVFSPDGREICYCADTWGSPGTSDNTDLFLIPSTGGDARRITHNRAADESPAYSPDGGQIAYTAGKRPNTVGEQRSLAIYDRSAGTSRIPENHPDVSARSPYWSPDGSGIYFHAEEGLKTALFRYDIGSGVFTKIMSEACDASFSLSPDGRRTAFVRSAGDSPEELHIMESDGGAVTRLTAFHKALTDGKDMSVPEIFSFRGAAGDKIEGLLVPPVFREAGKKYPVLLMLHGGPQFAWRNDFGLPYNSQIYAAAGYAVIKINPTGSTGYGQKFTDGVRREWGGTPYRDLMLGLDWLIKRYPYLDSGKIAVYGNSYGGYMANWMAGQTDRFACLICAGGVYNTVSQYGMSDVKIGMEGDFGGPPWLAAGEYEKWSPHNHAGRMKTPALILCGEKDRRVLYGEGLQLFTALQRQNVPSKLVLFPDEGHSVTRPHNLLFQFRTVLDWLDRWCKTAKTV